MRATAQATGARGRWWAGAHLSTRSGGAWQGCHGGAGYRGHAEHAGPGAVHRAAHSSRVLDWGHPHEALRKGARISGKGMGVWVGRQPPAHAQAHTHPHTAQLHAHGRKHAHMDTRWREATGEGGRARERRRGCAPVRGGRTCTDVSQSASSLAACLEPVHLRWRCTRPRSRSACSSPATEVRVRPCGTGHATEACNTKKAFRRAWSRADGN
jgi:hypothetical protein